MAQDPRWKRVLLKLSGEACAGESGSGLDMQVIRFIAHEIRKVASHGVQVAAVVGGGNLVRGAQLAASGIVDRATADYMGMLATVINALALRNCLEGLDVETRVQTAITMPEVAEPFIRLRAISHLEKGRVVIFAAGTGNPFFTTDTAAALRAAEIGAEALLMAKNRVDGVYDKDPNRYAGARRFEKLSYQEVYSRQLKVLDLTALSLAMENKLPIVVFDISKEDNIARAVFGEPVGTYIGSDAS